MPRSAVDLVRELGYRWAGLILSTPTSDSGTTTLIDENLDADLPSTAQNFNAWVYGGLDVPDLNVGVERRAASWSQPSHTLTFNQAWPSALLAQGTYEVYSRARRSRLVSAINSGIGMLGQNWYRPFIDTSIQTIANQYRYTLPSSQNWITVNRLEIGGPAVAGVVGFPYEELHDGWHVEEDQRGGVRTLSLQFADTLPAGQRLRIHGEGYFAEIEVDTDTLEYAGPAERAALEWIWDYAEFRLDSELLNRGSTLDQQKAQAIRLNKLQDLLTTIKRGLPNHQNVIVRTPLSGDGRRRSSGARSLFGPSPPSGSGGGGGGGSGGGGGGGSGTCSCTAELAVLTAQIAALASTVSTLSSTVASLVSTTTTLSSAIAALTGRVVDLEAFDPVADSRLDALEAAGGTDLTTLRHQVDVNLISNPNVEVTSDGYETTGSGAFVRSNAAGVAYVGDWGLVVTTANVSDSGIKYTSDVGTIGEAHTFSIRARLAVAGSKAMVFYVDWYDVDNNFLSEDTATFTLNSTVYAPFSITTGAAPVDADHAQLYAVTDGAQGIFNYYTDGWQFEEGSVATDLNVDGNRLTVLTEMINPGDPDGMLDFGESGKANAINQGSPVPGHAGYDREFDRTFLGGQAILSTLNDAVTIMLARQQNEDATTTGWPGSQGTARLDFGAIDKDGNDIYPNGADGAFAALTTYLRIAGSGNTPADGWGIFLVSLINELQSSVAKPPRDIVRLTGENGNEIWGMTYDSSGNVATEVLLFPRPDVFGS